MSFAYGKMKVLPVFYCSREMNNFTAWEGKETLKEVYSEEKITMAVNGLAPHLVKLDYFQRDNAENLLQSAFKFYIRCQFNKIDTKLLSKPSLFLSYFKTIKEKLRIRSRLYNYYCRVFYQGCPPLIYRNNIKDYERVKKSVLSSALSFDELNEARKQIYYSSVSSKQNQK